MLQMQHDGEQFKKRFFPGQASKRVEEDHLARYKFAGQFVRDKEVLDIACGVGYGSKLLKESGAKTVDGVDLSDEAINFAKSYYCTGGVNFFVSNAESYSPGREYDVIISLVTIEQIPDFKAALKNFYSLLKPKGILIISSPNRIVTSPDLKNISDKPVNLIHAREFTGQELLRELELCGFAANGECMFGQRQRIFLANKYLRRLYKIIFNPDSKSSPAVESIKKGRQPRYFVIKVSKS